MPARRSARRSAAAGADGLGRTVSKDAAGSASECHDRASVGASELADGKPHHHRFGDDDEQRLRDYLGAVAVWHAAGSNRRGGPPAVHDSFHGGVRGWFYFGATGTNGHAHAHSICVNLSREGGI